MNKRQKDAKRLRELITASGMSKRGAARELGISERAMLYHCSGDHDVPRIVLLAMEHVRLIGPGQPVCFGEPTPEAPEDDPKTFLRENLP